MVRISGPGHVGGITSTKSSKAKSSKSSSKSGDKIRIADAERLREQAQVMLANMPEVRMERIEEIRDALEQGNYEVPSQEVAVRIVINALAERSW